MSWVQINIALRGFVLKENIRLGTCLYCATLKLVTRQLSAVPLGCTCGAQNIVFIAGT
jgi:hypothetical protein